MSTDVAAEVARYRTERATADSFPHTGALIRHVAERDGLSVVDVHEDVKAAVEAGTVGVHLRVGGMTFLHLPDETPATER